MKFGIFCLNERYTQDVHQSITDQVDLVEYADTLGFDEAWFAEHHFNNFSIIPDPLALMAYAAARTRNIRLGSAGFLAPFYHPVRLAESISVLDHLSNGRLDAGFAKGGFAPDTRHFVRSKEDLRSVMFETVEALDRLLHGNHVSYEGDFVRIADSTVTPSRYQNSIPFYIATFSSEETIAFAARNGYGLMMSQGATLEECIEAQNYYRFIAGHDPHMVILRILYLDETLERAQRAVIPGIDHFVKCMRAAQGEQTQPTFDAKRYRELLEERNAFFDGRKFFDNAILGSDDDCIQTLAMFREKLTYPHIALKPASSDPSENRRMLSRFMTHVTPHFKLKEAE